MFFFSSLKEGKRAELVDRNIRNVSRDGHIKITKSTSGECVGVSVFFFFFFGGGTEGGGWGKVGGVPEGGGKVGRVLPTVEKKEEREQ